MPPPAYKQAGEGDRAVLFLHGIGGNRNSFDGQLDALPAGWRGLAWDMPGYGDSAPLPETTFAALADAAVALLDAAGAGKAVILGHSMGGMIAQELALATPDRLSGLILMDTHHGRVGSIDPELADLAVAVAREQGMTALQEAIDALGSPLETEAARRLRERRPELTELDRAKFRAASPSMYEGCVAWMLHGPDRIDRLRTLQVPTQVQVGLLDEPFLDAAHAMAKAIPGAELVEFPQAGHSPQLETPAAWGEAVITFATAASRPCPSG